MKQLHTLRTLCVSFLISLLLPFAASAAPAEPTQPDTNPDPLEGFNRAMFTFNENLDEYVLLPVTRGYKAVTPDMVETGVSNFFSNLNDISVLVNSALQLKIHDSLHTTARFIANTFFGLGGLIDVATPLGLEKKNEDFGQTLGYWGVASGPYLVLPVFGPGSLRDSPANMADRYYLDPVMQLEDDGARYGLMALWAVDKRAQLMEKERVITGDRYTFIRDAYMQNREFLVNDGKAAPKFDDSF